MNSVVLNSLVNKGIIRSYQYENLPESIGSKLGMRDHECVTLEFNNGDKLKIDTICSGCLECTSLILEMVSDGE